MNGSSHTGGLFRTRRIERKRLKSEREREDRAKSEREREKKRETLKRDRTIWDREMCGRSTEEGNL